ncbi:Predicted dehydrogenase [Kaistia soli DSM 19436]|uniref:Predicted dehydrogenase n=2 Tax=Kaistia TaxID=166953 RepID=A0A1M5E1Y6_9HYPH|nr:Predicted dehydrogenase [Kaistia soli DSM 19436]
MRVGMVGAGWVTQYHLPGWAAVDGADVVAICDPDGEAASDRARAFGIGAQFDTIEAMLDGAELDALDICSPRPLHAPHVRAGAARGLALLCQKPLGVDLGEAEALVADTEGRARLMVHENWRFRPYYRRLAAWLREGVVGDIVSIRFEFHSSGMLPGPDGARPALVRQPFFRSLDRLLVMEVLIHHLDTLRFLFGEFDMVTARLGRSNSEIIGEDSAILTLSRRGDGVPLSISGNLAVHGAPPAPIDRLSIYGSKGTILLEDADLRLVGAELRHAPFDARESYQAAYGAAIRHFVEQTRSGAPYETSPQDNLETLRLVERAYTLSGFEACASAASPQLA